ncbi:MAG: sigma-70 family RNA polymerase sigma factor [Planctomycetes bacterium]|nr:sigma-70 family RNA polymerase sigma factor [Planctomycetota bacterium]
MTRFPSTLWSVVVAAGAGSRKALEELARRYERPIRLFVRGRGYGEHDAEDLVQQFFVFLLEANLPGRADSRRGRFRSFLCAALRHFLADQADRARAAKRGGDRRELSLDSEGAEERLGVADRSTPDRVFAALCARETVSRALARLEGEITPRAAEIFELSTSPGQPSYREIGERFGISENAVAASVHRTRARLKALVLDEVRATVASPRDVLDDLAELLAALGEDR